MPAAKSSSGARINYSLRPNKFVERRLVFDALKRLSASFGGPYRYYGFGSFWFTDFMLAHRTLGIRSMVSMEHKDSKRALANRPLSSIRVRAGRSTKVLPKAGLHLERAVVWLDYDGKLDPSVFEDINTCCERVRSGSVVLITLNAFAPRSKDNDREKYKELLGDLMPDPVPDGYFQEAPDRFPARLAEVVLAVFRRALADRPNMNLRPLFNFFYEDGAPMITVGVAIVSKRDDMKFTASGVTKALGATEEQQCVIAVPILTTREKLALDTLLPRSKPLSVRTARRRGVVLDSTAINSYLRYYLQYPVFAEILP
jgi:hypothetical protein